MPLPLGHSAIGLATHDVSTTDTALTKWKLLIFVSLLANLPDVDVLVGLLLRDNGAAFHRGPTHSLLFALAMGWIASWLGKNRPNIIPRLSFGVCFLVVFSHVLSDLFLTTAPVSLLWPLESNWSLGYAGWTDVLNSVFLRAFQDGGIILTCALLILAKQTLRKLPRYRRLAVAFLRRRQHPKAPY